ncbi:enhanced intracellular survival protein Eis [Mycobacterium sp. GA-2829]|uniref:enhanced intracellular survival protein Eis n=1 Tax=Mycobacterium sp. GA-2829 TaxID=1772283 RepID=UPI00073FC494|nr:enhanced intracellular survival protein Eis [Mycobacterium sp. GA-2829]KUI37125.1 hypothetical protein AU194_11440 [Mycobacterium sp. GA-2829]
MTSSGPSGIVVRGGEESDRPGIGLLTSTGFGEEPSPEADAMWDSITPDDGVVVACDGPDVVGVAKYFDLSLTLPGGGVLPMAGVSDVVVAPTHRRRGVLRAMFAELHDRIVAAGYPAAGLTASEGGIYGRFGYGPATIDQSLRVERKRAAFHPDVPDPGGVRIVRPGEHRAEFEEIYERWRLRTPGGLPTPKALWDNVFADRPEGRGGGTSLFALLHADGFAFYRVHGARPDRTARVTKFAALTPDAHTALWRALMGLDLMDAVEINTHPGDALPYLLADARVVRTTGAVDDLWLRLLDVPTTLAARHYGADLSIVVEVAGGGRFALDVRDGRAECAPTDRPADVHTDLSVVGSLFLGAHKASAFAAAGRLRCADGALLPLIDAAFASDVPAQLGFGF